MPMESSFLNLNRGNRLSSYMGLEMAPGVASLPFTPGFTHIDIPPLHLEKDDGTVLEQGLRNQHLRIVPACTVDLRGDYKLLVEPNPALAAVGSVQGMYYIQSGSGRQAPGIWITLRKDFNPADLPWVVRLYLRI